MVISYISESIIKTYRISWFLNGYSENENFETTFTTFAFLHASINFQYHQFFP